MLALFMLGSLFACGTKRNKIYIYLIILPIHLFMKANASYL